MRVWRFLFALLLLGVLVGCSKETVTYRFEIKSDVAWHATYEKVGVGHGTLVSGEGDKTIPINESPPVCIIVNGDGEGYIEVSAYKHVSKNGGLFNSDTEEDILQDTAKTTEPNGERTIGRRFPERRFSKSNPHFASSEELIGCESVSVTAAVANMATM
ncbi:MAG: hypothetical protein P8181_09285, partial [bacterium]